MLTVLVISDSAGWREMQLQVCRIACAGLRRLTLAAVEPGGAVLEQLRRAEYGLAFVDLNMPPGDARSVIDTLQGTKRCWSIRVTQIRDPHRAKVAVGGAIRAVAALVERRQDAAFRPHH